MLTLIDNNINKGSGLYSNQIAKLQKEIANSYDDKNKINLEYNEKYFDLEKRENEFAKLKSKLEEENSILKTELTKLKNKKNCFSQDTLNTYTELSDIQKDIEREKQKLSDIQKDIEREKQEIDLKLKKLKAQEEIQNYELKTKQQQEEIQNYELKTKQQQEEIQNLQKQQLNNYNNYLGQSGGYSESLAQQLNDCNNSFQQSEEQSCGYDKRTDKLEKNIEFLRNMTNESNESIYTQHYLYSDNESNYNEKEIIADIKQQLEQSGGYYYKNLKKEIIADIKQQLEQSGGYYKKNPSDYSEKQQEKIIKNSFSSYNNNSIVENFLIITDEKQGSESKERGIMLDEQILHDLYKSLDYEYNPEEPVKKLIKQQQGSNYELTGNIEKLKNQNQKLQKENKDLVSQIEKNIQAQGQAQGSSVQNTNSTDDYRKLYNMLRKYIKNSSSKLSKTVYYKDNQSTTDPLSKRIEALLNRIQDLLNKTSQNNKTHALYYNFASMKRFYS